ncbi:hypothetical protein PPERSA_03283 [Pseudocohnilembus persalinus]|uniref:Uncharacterized protein n=1 Tax=Pseudocohnilembus persalinus TaxID=266149 RepID=A0A0V0Q8U3_PSEPJ|nr:hypothetical protein PPERSA_03283 [Pseudocohnilembus persalinus]|eukprot:KRW98452.1 hypothetical protein PPERSA_03283 [Pseudocohnilembus persalinus]
MEQTKNVQNFKYRQQNQNQLNYKTDKSSQQAKFTPNKNKINKQQLIDDELFSKYETQELIEPKQDNFKQSALQSRNKKFNLKSGVFSNIQYINLQNQNQLQQFNSEQQLNKKLHQFDLVQIPMIQIQNKFKQNHIQNKYETLKQQKSNNILTRSLTPNIKTNKIQLYNQVVNSDSKDIDQLQQKNTFFANKQAWQPNILKKLKDSNQNQRNKVFKQNPKNQNQESDCNSQMNQEQLQNFLQSMNSGTNSKQNLTNSYSLIRKKQKPLSREFKNINDQNIKKEYFNQQKSILNNFFNICSEKQQINYGMSNFEKQAQPQFNCKQSYNDQDDNLTQIQNKNNCTNGSKTYTINIQQDYNKNNQQVFSPKFENLSYEQNQNEYFYESELSDENWIGNDQINNYNQSTDQKQNLLIESLRLNDKKENYVIQYNQSSDEKIQYQTDQFYYQKIKNQNHIVDQKESNQENQIQKPVQDQSSFSIQQQNVENSCQKLCHKDNFHSEDKKQNIFLSKNLNQLLISQASNKQQSATSIYKNTQSLYKNIKASNDFQNKNSQNSITNSLKPVLNQIKQRSQTVQNCQNNKNSYSHTIKQKQLIEKQKLFQELQLEEKKYMMNKQQLNNQIKNQIQQKDYLDEQINQKQQLQEQIQKQQYTSQEKEKIERKKINILDLQLQNSKLVVKQEQNKRIIEQNIKYYNLKIIDMQQQMQKQELQLQNEDKKLHKELLDNEAINKQFKSKLKSYSNLIQILDDKNQQFLILQDNLKKSQKEVTFLQNDSVQLNQQLSDLKNKINKLDKENTIGQQQEQMDKKLEKIRNKYNFNKQIIKQKKTQKLEELDFLKQDICIQKDQLSNNIDNYAIQIQKLKDDIISNHYQILDKNKKYKFNFQQIDIQLQNLKSIYSKISGEEYNLDELQIFNNEYRDNDQKTENQQEYDYIFEKQNQDSIQFLTASSNQNNLQNLLIKWQNEGKDEKEQQIFDQQNLELLDMGFIKQMYSNIDDQTKQINDLIQEISQRIIQEKNINDQYQQKIKAIYEVQQQFQNEIENNLQLNQMIENKIAKLDKIIEVKNNVQNLQKQGYQKNKEQVYLLKQEIERIKHQIQVLTFKQQLIQEKNKENEQLIQNYGLQYNHNLDKIKYIGKNQEFKQTLENFLKHNKSKVNETQI